MWLISSLLLSSMAVSAASFETERAQCAAEWAEGVKVEKFGPKDTYIYRVNEARQPNECLARLLSEKAKTDTRAFCAPGDTTTNPGECAVQFSREHGNTSSAVAHALLAVMNSFSREMDEMKKQKSATLKMKKDLVLELSNRLVTLREQFNLANHPFTKIVAKNEKEAAGLATTKKSESESLQKQMASLEKLLTTNKKQFEAAPLKDAEAEAAFQKRWADVEARFEKQKAKSWVVP